MLPAQSRAASLDQSATPPAPHFSIAIDPLSEGFNGWTNMAPSVHETWPLANYAAFPTACSFAPRISARSIEGGAANSSGALAINAFAIGPFR